MIESEFHLFVFLLCPLVFSNIEDIAREAGSVDVDEESLYCK